MQRWTFTGTNTGPLILSEGEMPATGKRVELTGVSVSKISEGKYTEEWVYWDGVTFLTQLGFTIEPPSLTSQE